MRFYRGWRSLSVTLCLFVGACCTVPIAGSTDWPGVAPYLNGTWQAIAEGEFVLQTYIDSTGDPVSASLGAGLLNEDLPAGIPTQILLDGASHNVPISGVPVTVSYVARARANKTNPSDPIAVDETVTIVVEMDLYATVGLSAVKAATGLITFTGKFTSTFEAEGSVRVIITLTSQAQQIISSIGQDIPFQNMDQTISGVQLIRR
ncbi:MAG: hypothetical protein JXQ73_17295 [Phycisphaerae bacterium]|nr:hypothetical protein [Phycisphaerae bacterium]